MQGGLLIIMVLMVRKRISVALALLFIVVQVGFGAVATRPSISAGIGGSFCIPTADYLKEYPGNPDVDMPPFRTSRLLTLDVEFLNVSFIFGRENESAVQIGCGISFLNVSRSIAYGDSVLKPYNGIGVLGDLDYRINRHFDVDFRYRFLQCFFSGSSARFIAHEFELAPYYRFFDSNAVEMSVGIPIALLWKADAISVNASVAVLINIDSLGMRFNR